MCCKTVPSFLLPLGVQHLHEEGLRGGGAVHVLQVQELLAVLRQEVKLGQQLQKLLEFFLRTGRTRG